MLKTVNIMKCIYFKRCNNTFCNHTLSRAVIRDYFGQIEPKYYKIINGIYKSLFINKGIRENLLENCFYTNRLDELIHTKFKYEKSEYYEQFCKLNLKIGATYYDLRAPEDKDSDGEHDDIDSEDGSIIYNTNYFNHKKLTIYDDNHCPSCFANDFQNNRINEYPPDCCECLNIICILCSNYHEDKASYICNYHDIQKFNKTIKIKIKSYNEQDLQKFKKIGNISCDDIKELFNKQRYKCYICDDVVISCNWKNLCCYQWTLDKIDNNIPHNKDNVLISCYFCNCRSYPDFKQHNKICSSGCHTKNRDIKETKYNISIEKINKLKLNN